MDEEKKAKLPTPFQRKTLWNALTGLSLLVLLALLVGMIWLGGQVLAYLQPVLLPLAVAGIVAYLLDPIVTWLQGRGLSRLWAVISVFIVGVVFMTLMTIFCIKAFGQLSNLQVNWKDIANRTGAVLTTVAEKPMLKPVLDSVGFKSIKPIDEGDAEGTSVALGEFMGKALGEHGPKLVEQSITFINRGATKVFGVLGFLLGFLMVPVYLYFFLRESAYIRDSWVSYFPLKASKFKDEVVDVFQEINGYLLSFFRGQVLVSIIDGLLVGVVLTAIGLHSYGILIGVLLAILGVIPFLGNILTLVPATLITYAHFSVAENHTFFGSNPWSYVLAVVIIFVAVQQLNSLVTAPKIVGDSVGLHPMTVIFSMLFWTLILGGFLGALLAVPLTASVKVLFKRYVWEARLSEIVHNEALEPIGEPFPIEEAILDENNDDPLN